MEKIYIAKLGKAVGLQGQQRLHIDSDFPEQFQKDLIVYTDKNQKLTIESYSINNSVVKFIGIDDINQAKKLTNRQLFVSQNDTREACNLGDKQFFWFDILGCTVIENDKVLGVVDDIQRMPLSDYIQVKTTEELVKENYSNTFLLPYLDDYVLSVDIAKKEILVKGAVDILEAS